MKLKNAIIALVLLLCLSVCSLLGCTQTQVVPTGAAQYKLTVEDPDNNIIEPLNASYKAGERVTVKLFVVVGSSVAIYLNDMIIDDLVYTEKENRVYWEFSFEMPEKDSTLTVEYRYYVPPEPVSAVVLSSDIANEIKEAYAQKHNVSVSTVSFACYGVFDDSYALMMYCTEFGYTAAIEYDNFGTVKFTYSSGNKMTVYNNGNFYYSLSAAYKDELLTKNDLREIALNVSSVSSRGVWALALSEELEAEIIDCYYETLKEENADKQKILLSSYYGEFNGYHAVSIGIEGTAPYGRDVIETIIADGILFGEESHIENKIVFFNAFGIQLFKDGKFFTLKYAVENKLISLEDYMDISDNGFSFISR